MKIELIFTYLFLIVILANCQSTDRDVSKHGYEYQRIESAGNGNIVKPGDRILYYQTVYKNDTLLQSGVFIEILPDESKFKKIPVNLELIYLMKEGDSSIIAQKFDTVTILPNGLKKTDVIKFAIRVKEVTDAKVASTDLQNGLMAKQEIGKGLANIARLYRSDSLTNFKTTASGLKYQVSSLGNGKPFLKGERAVVNFIGVREDGSEFDSSWNRGAPFIFRVGLQEVILAWEETLKMFPRGTRVTIICPPELAYGQKGNLPVIGENSTLLFYIDILDKSI